MAGNWGNWGNWGNSGSGVSGGAAVSAGLNGEVGGGWFIEDRVDLPFVTEPADETDDPLVLPAYDDFEGAVGKEVRHHLPNYADRQWGAQWQAWRVLEEFAHRNWYHASDATMLAHWKQANAPGDAAGLPSTTEKEIRALVRAARDERPAAMGEILSQHVEFITDFMALLTMSPGSHPRTYRVLHIASLIGAFVSLHYKAKDDWHTLDAHVPSGPRPRPSQFCPALAPPVPVPGHPAFPSGHATQATLMARSISYVLGPEEPGSATAAGETNGYGASISTAPAPAPIDASDRKVIEDNLFALARRIARNREIAGLHYRSDSVAGRALAEKVFGELRQCDCFKQAVKAARAEWT